MSIKALINQSRFRGLKAQYIWYLGGGLGMLQSYPRQIAARILNPLGMQSTCCGYPADSSDKRIPLIVTPQKWDGNNKKYTVDPDVAAVHTAYPASGLLTSLEDLVKYSNALDDNALLSKDSYHTMTSTFISNSGKSMPYGLGWSTMEYGRTAVHWHYGFGDSYAALIIRLPATKKTGIVLLQRRISISAFSFRQQLVTRFPICVVTVKSNGAFTGRRSCFSV